MSARADAVSEVRQGGKRLSRVQLLFLKGKIGRKGWVNNVCVHGDS